jgi:hypothetical protein
MIEFAYQIGQRLKAARFVNHLAQLLTFARERFARWLHVPVAQLSPVEVMIQPEAVAKEVEHLPLLAQVARMDAPNPGSFCLALLVVFHFKPLRLLFSSRLVLPR